MEPDYPNEKRKIKSIYDIGYEDVKLSSRQEAAIDRLCQSLSVPIAPDTILGESPLQRQMRLEEQWRYNHEK